MEDRGKLLKVRNGIRLPWRSIPKPEHHGPYVRQDGLPPPPASDRHETGRLPGSFRASSRRRPRPGTSNPPSLPVSPKRPSSARIASRPWRAMPPALSKRMPDGSASSSQKGPSRLSRAIPAPRKQARERKKTLRPSSLPSLPPPSSPAVWHASFQTAADNDGDFRPDLKKVFSGMGRAREGKGQFLQKTPLPLSSFPCSTVPPQQKSGAVTCTRFYRKNKGTIVGYFFSPLCLRLWPCCMK